MGKSWSLVLQYHSVTVFCCEEYFPSRSCEIFNEYSVHSKYFNVCIIYLWIYMEYDEIQIVIITSTVVLFTVLIIVITLFSLLQKKKVSFILREKEQEKQFEEILNNSQIEIRENALKNIAWELHDNVGQLLSLAKMQLNILQPNLADANADKVQEIGNLIGETLQEIRSLSKTLNPEVINNMGLRQAIENDIDRFNKLKFLDAKFEVTGEEYDISKKDVIILFRILQEFFSNTIKHSQATSLVVKIDYAPKQVILCAKDNGKGFDIATAKMGSGLINMKSRATLIKTKLNHTSNASGTKIELIYPNKKLNQDEK